MHQYTSMIHQTCSVFSIAGSSLDNTWESKPSLHCYTGHFSQKSNKQCGSTNTSWHIKVHHLKIGTLFWSFLKYFHQLCTMQQHFILRWKTDKAIFPLKVKNPGPEKHKIAVKSCKVWFLKSHLSNQGLSHFVGML